jgi:hypothetical protein
MTLVDLAKRAEKLVADRSPLILTAVGVTGTITTAVLTGKAAIKADRLLEKEKYYQSQRSNTPVEVLPPKEMFLLVWKLYIPPASVGALTVTSIILANQIGTRRAAAMAAAYALSEKAFTEYKEKVVEKIGENKERLVRDDLAQDQVRNNPVTDNQILMTGGGTVLCYEPFTGRYFNSDMESLKKAQNDLNYQVLSNYYASLSDFYDLVGLPRTKISDDLGWNSDEILELNFSTVLSDDGRPCISIDFKVAPIRDYYRVH